jgi:AAA family ATP:ADP antiporter
VRDGFFLSQVDVTMLPVATLAAAVVSFVASLLLGKLITAFSPAAAVPVLFGANALLFFVEAALIVTAPRMVASTLYLHTAALGGAVVSGFWSVVNERFDPYTARKVMGRIAAGATFGGVLGGALTWWLSDLEAKLLLAGFGTGSLLCAVAIALVAPTRRNERTTPEPAALLSGVKTLVENSYPRSIGAVVFLAALFSGTVDYVFKAGVVDATPTKSLVGFFAVFYTVAGVATFVAQALASRRSLKTLGVVPTVALYPLIGIFLVVVALLAPSLVTLVLVRGGSMVVENSLYRSGYELLYTAVPRTQKRSAKVLIDLGCDRLGTAAASGLALLVIAGVSSVVDRMLLLTALAVAVIIVGTLLTVRREYVASLARQLQRNLRPEAQEDIHGSAVRLASTFVAEAQIMDDVRHLSIDRSEDAGTRPMSRQEFLAKVLRHAAAKPPFARSVVAAPVSRVSERLLKTPLRERLHAVAELEPELRQSAPALVGQLGDILLSSRDSLRVRLLAAELLALTPSPRAAASLLAALNSPELRLRRASALALCRICEAAPALRPRRRVLTDHAAKELRRPCRPLDERSSFELTSPFLEDAYGNQLAPSLELAFLLLAVHGNTAKLRLALSAITSKDPIQRGTGLEYLDNLLPKELRAHALALAERPELTQAYRRVPAQVVDRLAGELRDGRIDIRKLRNEFRRARRAQYDQQL